MSRDPERRCPSCESEEARAIVERLCKLAGAVHSEVGYEHASDCFCGAGGFWGSEWYNAADFRHDLATVEFIEAAVAQQAALAARVRELEARITRAVEVVGMAPSYSTRGRAISILRGEDDDLHNAERHSGRSVQRRGASHGGRERHEEG